jgi:polysaccharide export outer membrane protein
MTSRYKLNFLIPALLLGFFLPGCAVNSNIMFKEAKGLAVNSDSIPLHPKEDYKIAVDDKISFTMSTNDGKRLIEGMTGTGDGQIRVMQQQEYLVRQNGMVELPMIGEIPVKGLTIAACEDTLENYFSSSYQNPFIQVQVTNKRVIVFPGSGSDARVVPLINNNTTLMEVIAAAGGIPERGRARSIKVMRKEGDQRVIYRIDLSTIDGLRYADMIVQGNDYIYVDPNPDLAKGVLKEVAPILSIFSSALIIFSIFNNL